MVSIIILSYNTKDLLKECLYSVFSQIKDVEFEVIVVDNASHDESVAMVKKEFPQVVLIESKENKGFGGGINLGVKSAKGDYLLFLNSDTKVNDAELKKMIELMKKNIEIGIIGGQLKNADGSIQRSFGRFYNLKDVAILLFGSDKAEMTLHKAEKVTPVDWVSGGFMLISTSVFQKLHGFDEKIFMYMEDMEICYRVKKEGYSVLFFPDTDVIHMGQGSSNRSFAIIHIYKGLLYFYKKHKSVFAYHIVKLLLQLKAIIAISIGIVTRNSYLTTTYRKAIQF